MAWTTPRTWVSNETLTAALLNTHLRDNLEELDVAKVTAPGQYAVSTAANALTARSYGWERINTSQNLVSPSGYSDLSTVGPTVTVTTGTRALVLIAGQLDHGTDNGDSKISYAISGATTQAASDTWCIRRDGMAAGNSVRLSRHDLRVDLNAGSNTFTMKYFGSAGTQTYSNRVLAVFPL